MVYLFGNHRHVIDSKGRLSIPLRFRDLLIKDGSRRLTICGGFEGCLFVYAWDAFQKIMDQLGSHSFDRVAVRELLRGLAEFGSEVDMDAQGRIPLTRQQREVAGLDHEALVIGVGSRLEIWSPARFSDRPNQADGATLAEGVLQNIDSKTPEGKE